MWAGDPGGRTCVSEGEATELTAGGTRGPGQLLERLWGLGWTGRPTCLCVYMQECLYLQLKWVYGLVWVLCFSVLICVAGCEYMYMGAPWVRVCWEYKSSLAVGWTWGHGAVTDSLLAGFWIRQLSNIYKSRISLIYPNQLLLIKERSLTCFCSPWNSPRAYKHLMININILI